MNYRIKIETTAEEPDSTGNLCDKWLRGMKYPGYVTLADAFVAGMATTKPIGVIEAAEDGSLSIVWHCHVQAGDIIYGTTGGAAE